MNARHRARRQWSRDSTAGSVRSGRPGGAGLGGSRTMRRVASNRTRPAWAVVAVSVFVASVTGLSHAGAATPAPVKIALTPSHASFRADGRTALKMRVVVTKSGGGAAIKNATIRLSAKFRVSFELRVNSSPVIRDAERIRCRDRCDHLDRVVASSQLPRRSAPPRTPARARSRSQPGVTRWSCSQVGPRRP